MKCPFTNIFEVTRKLVKSLPCCKGVGHSVFRDFFLFLATAVGQKVKIPPPLTESTPSLTFMLSNNQHFASVYMTLAKMPYLISLLIML